MSEQILPWEVTGDRYDWIVKRQGVNTGWGAEAYYLIHDDPPESLAARLNDLDTARARIALLEARLDALCGAVAVAIQPDPDELCPDEYGCKACDAVRAAYAALTAAREVLGG